MFSFKSAKSSAGTLKPCKEMEKLFNEIQINLENNYKDLAITARKNAELRLEELNAEGAFSPKEYNKLKVKLDTYTQRMVGYHH